MKLRGRNEIKPEFNMSSMTDVVFLLLIFFMIASTLAKQLNTIDVKLPQADGKTENRNTVAITITNSNQFYLDSDKISKQRLENLLIKHYHRLKLLQLFCELKRKLQLIRLYMS